jgi:L-lactate utilization protein LutB
MSLKKIGENPVSEKDQLLDRLSALDQNHPDYESEKKMINEQLQKIAENPEEIINYLNQKAEKKLSEVDHYAADQTRQAIDDKQSIDQLLSEINSTPVEKNDTNTVGQNSYEGFYEKKLNKIADGVKKAIRSVNWHSFKQLSKAEKDDLCAQIDSLVSGVKKTILIEQEKKSDELVIQRLVNEGIYQVQKIADDRHIKIPFEY